MLCRPCRKAGKLDNSQNIEPKPGEEHFLPTKRSLRGLSITDEGCGITPEHPTKIFNFFQHQKRGGLGLATSNAIIQKHNGHIEVKSQEGVNNLQRLSSAKKKRVDTNR